MIMGWFSKDKIRVEDVSPEIAMLILAGISDKTLNDIKDWEIDINKAEHKLEIILLLYYAYLQAVWQTFGMKSLQLSFSFNDYVRQHLSRIYVEKLGYLDMIRFKETMEKRFKEYDKVWDSDLKFDNKVQEIGRIFIKEVGTDNPFLLTWSVG
jgi:hypothetical protein